MDKKVIVIGTAAVAAIALGAWLARDQIMPSREIRSPSRPTPSGQPGPDGSGGGERRVELEEGEAPEWVRADPLEGVGDALVFASHSSPAEAARSLENARTTLNDTASSGLDGIPYDAQLGVVESWSAFILPVVADDKAGFARAVASFGGVGAFDEAEGSGLPSDALFDRLSPYFAGASFDVNQARVRQADPSKPMAVPTLVKMPGMPDIPPGRVPMMAMQSDTRTQEGGPTQSRVAVSMPFESLFPRSAAALAGGSKVVEVWIPVRLAGSKNKSADLAVSSFMVRTGDGSAWVPLSMRLQLLSEESRNRMPRRGG